MLIDSCYFGHITVNGKQYDNDIIILPGGGILPWRRKEGHNLMNEDLGKAYAAKPEVLYIGTGSYGAMKVSDEVREYCAKNGIELTDSTSGHVAELFNKDDRKRKALGIHLTC